MRRPTRRFRLPFPVACFGLFALAGTLAAASIQAQEEAPLQGFVADELTGEVISSARVRILETNLEVRTGSGGTFAFPDPPHGEISVRVQADGYPMVVDNVEVKPGEVVFMHVVLPQVQYVLGELFVTGTPTRPRDGVDQHAQTAADLLIKQIPGAFQEQGIVGLNDAEIVLRGTSSMNLSNEPIILLDGVRLGGGFGDALDALKRIPAAQVRQVRVLRGPAAAFIQGAANGAVFVETRSGRDDAR